MQFNSTHFYVVYGVIGEINRPSFFHWYQLIVLLLVKKKDEHKNFLLFIYKIRQM